MKSDDFKITEITSAECFGIEKTIVPKSQSVRFFPGDVVIIDENLAGDIQACIAEPQKEVLVEGPLEYAFIDSNKVSEIMASRPAMGVMGAALLIAARYFSVLLPFLAIVPHYYGGPDYKIFKILIMLIVLGWAFATVFSFYFIGKRSRRILGTDEFRSTGGAGTVFREGHWAPKAISILNRRTSTIGVILIVFALIAWTKNDEADFQMASIALVLSALGTLFFFSDSRQKWWHPSIGMAIYFVPIVYFAAMNPVLEQLTEGRLFSIEVFLKYADFATALSSACAGLTIAGMVTMFRYFLDDDPHRWVKQTQENNSC